MQDDAIFYGGDIEVEVGVVEFAWDEIVHVSGPMITVG